MKQHICIVGLGYVGLPLAFAFAKKGYTVSGFDINQNRIEELRKGHDGTHELTDSDLQSVQIHYDYTPSIIANADIVIMAIPTPVDADKKPDLTPVMQASETVGKYLKKGGIVVYESTVYPGTTEELCAPVLEQHSSMQSGKDFFLGYSPERINPGDKEHTVDKIIKIVAGQDERTTDILCDLYGSIITAGIHRAPNIKTAEMAKAIENAQRDLNIAFVNEVATLCHHIGIHTGDVLEAAGTKWNFLQFQPGLVGGHCIGVDPYYLVEKARQLNMETHVISAGRAVNDAMPELIAHETIDALGEGSGKQILILGLTFKENVPDIRNSQSFAVIEALRNAGYEVYADDPLVPEACFEQYHLKHKTLDDAPFDAILLLVKHDAYLSKASTIIHAVSEGGVLYDVKGVLSRKETERQGKIYKAL